MLDGVWEGLAARINGPMAFRFVLQPAMATVIAMHAGWLDARFHRPPFLWTLVTNRRERRALLLSGWRDVGRVFILAWLVDVVYQVVMLRAFRPGQALLVAALLAFVPYVLVRGLTTRVVRRTPSFRRLGA